MPRDGGGRGAMRRVGRRRLRRWLIGRRSFLILSCFVMLTSETSFNEATQRMVALLLLLRCRDACADGATDR